MSSLPNSPSSPHSAAAMRQEAAERQTTAEPGYPTLHNSRFDVLSDFWFIFADSTRNSFHLNAIAWDHVAAFTVVAFVAAAAVDWYLPGSQLGFDIGLTLLTGIATIVAYAVRAGLAERALDAAPLSQDNSQTTKAA